MELDQLVRRAYRQILQLFSANLMKAFIGFVGTLFVLRTWSAADIGDIYTLIGVMMVFQQFGDLGTGSSFIQLLSRTREQSLPIIETYLGFKLIVFFFLFTFFILTTGYYFFVLPSQEVYGLAAVTLAAIFGIYGGFFTAMVTAHQEYGKLAILKVLPPTLKTILIIFLYFLGTHEFYWLLIAFVLPSFTLFFTGLLLTGFPFHRHAFNLGAIFTRRGGQLYHMSKWVFLVGFSQTAFAQIDIFMLKRMSSDTQIALFVSASKLAISAFMFSQAIFTVMLPKMRDFKSDEELIFLSFKIFKLYAFFLILMIPAGLISPYIIPALLGERYTDSIPIFQIYLYLAVGHMFINSQSLIFYRKNLLAWLVLFSFTQLALNFIGNYLVIYKYHALGAVSVSAVLNNLFYFICLGFSYFYLKGSGRASKSLGPVDNSSSF